METISNYLLLDEAEYDLKNYGGKREQVRWIHPSRSADNRSIFYRACARFVTPFASKIIKLANYSAHAFVLLCATPCHDFQLFGCKFAGRKKNATLFIIEHL